ncbi:hypothetical protein K0B04_02845 [Patescibacteria group bacterium]|nr:hypothetical protein [Patescibacteria group bacterium]
MRKIFLIFLTTVIFISILIPQHVEANNNPLVINYEVNLAIQYAEMAKSQMIGIYSWEEHRDCSSFVALYAKNMGIPVNWLEYGNGDYEKPFPWSNTVKQVQWARENYPEHIYDSTLDDFLSGNLWNDIKPRDIVYLTAPIGHNGYNTYYHTAVLVEYRGKGYPVFAEIASGIEASTDRTLEQLVSFYGYLGTKPHYTGNSTPEKLVFTWADIFSILGEIKNGSIEIQKKK